MNNSQVPDPNMIFLIGAARSGTKFLRDVLAESDAVSCVPFDVNYVWRYGNESQADDFIAPDQIGEDQSKFIRQTLTRMAYKSSGSEAPNVVEKTVSNVFRVPFILRLFPEAKFIHLVRDGRDVALSAAQQWATPSEMSYLSDKIRYFPIRNWSYAIWYLKNAILSRLGTGRKTKVWGPRYPGIDKDIGKLSTSEIAAKQWAESIAAADIGLAMVAEEQKFVIRYEDLVSDSQHLRRLIEFLGLPDSAKIIDIFDKQVSINKGGEWNNLPEEHQTALLKLLEPALSRFGYSRLTN